MTLNFETLEIKTSKDQPFSEENSIQGGTSRLQPLIMDLLVRSLHVVAEARHEVVSVELVGLYVNNGAVVGALLCNDVIVLL